MHDVFFLSYDEPFADKHWEMLRDGCPVARRIHGIKGIARALGEAALQCRSSHFFSVDADNVVLPDFSWTILSDIDREDRKVHVWRCRNEVNGLIYGFGAVKLWPASLVREFMDRATVDFTSEISREGVVIQDRVASVTHFDGSPYLAWKGAFRECTKLAADSALYVGTTRDPRATSRLVAWMSLGADRLYGDFCIVGARMGTLHGLRNRHAREQILKINDSDYMRSLFSEVVSAKDRLCQETTRELRQHGIDYLDLNAEQSRVVKALMHAL